VCVCVCVCECECVRRSFGLLLSAFAQSQKEISTFITSVRQSVRVSASIGTAPSGRVSVKFNIGG
jgi:hypothetical protein